MEHINQVTGQENDASYMAYMLGRILRSNQVMKFPPSIEAPCFWPKCLCTNTVTCEHRPYPAQQPEAPTELVHSSYVAETTAEIMRLKAVLAASHERERVYEQALQKIYALATPDSAAEPKGDAK